MMTARLFAAALGTAALFGCTVERDYQDPFSQADFGPGGDFEGERPGADLQLQAPVVRGDIGHVRDFDAPANDSYGYVDQELNATYVTLTGYDARGRMGMLILDMPDVDVRRMEPGVHTFSNSSFESNLYVTGCSSDDSNSYDAPADQGVIIIEDTPAGREVTVEATLPSDEGSTEASGGFVVARQ